MTAKRYTLRLYWRSTRERQCDTNIDPSDVDVLRQRLEEMVKVQRGTLNLDMSQWRLVVHSLGGGRVVATCRVSPSGVTEVDR